MKLDRREFLMLAKPSKGDEEIGGFFLSEKLDGMRCFWDGGVSRGFVIDQVPWANVGKGCEALSTGLWSRYGNPIYAPDWFLNELPCCPLDGELYCGRGRFQETMSIVKKKKPIDADWKKVTFNVFSSPCLDQVFRAGEIKNPNFERVIDADACIEFYELYTSADYVHITTATGAGAPFKMELEFLEPWLEAANPSVLTLLPQLKLPDDNDHAWEVATQRSKNIIEQGGEGCILRADNMPWTPKRVGYCLKIKDLQDAEAEVIGGTAGNTGKTGKYLGMMGNLIVRYTHEGRAQIDFELSGYNNDERKINSDELFQWAVANPGKQFPDELLTPGALQFEMGDMITFKFREYSTAGVPKDARYLRPRPAE